MPDHEFQLKMSAREIYKTIMVHFKMTLVRITHIGTLGSHLYIAILGHVMDRIFLNYP